MKHQKNKSRRRWNYHAPRFAPEALEAYANRPLNNLDFMKDIPEAELRAEVHALGYRFCMEPWAQPTLACFLIGTEQPAFNFFIDMGGRKTALLLNLFRYRKQRGEATRGLILVPEEIHMTTWTEQAPEHVPDLKLCVLTGSKAERMSLVEKKADLFIINHAGMQVYMSELSKGKRKRVINKDMAEEFVSRFDFMVLDEQHRIKTNTSLLFELIWWLSVRCPFRYGATGTPFGRDPATLWPQFKLIDHGETLGQTLGMFRAAFFDAKQNYWGGIEYTFRPDRIELLNQTIKHRSISYGEHELTALPPRVNLRSLVPLTEEGREYYKRIVDRLREKRGDYRSLDSIYLRMRQCASGFLSLKPEDDDESLERIQVRFPQNPKLDALRALIVDKIAGRKFIVYHHFRFSGRMISDLLDELKIGYAAIRGGMKDVRGEFTRFMMEKKCQALIANTQVGSEAINPQSVCNIEIYFESPEDPITRTQAERRVRRSGQKASHVLIYDLVVKGTIEEKLLQYHREGRNLLKAVMSGDETLIDPEKEEATA